MKNAEKHRLATAVVDHWQSFRSALAAVRRGVSGGERSKTQAWRRKRGPACLPEEPNEH
jgi:hypothetical protein